ncbi:MAG TPA: membrane protein insertase YidC [Alphaproteobacteria bacterium]|nr:membrane protein insertase YidC [Alphaproteobacteria bacterium]
MKSPLTPNQLPPSPPNSPRGMHQQDKRNLIIFAVAAMALWFLFEHFVLAPRIEAATKAREMAELKTPQTIASEQAVPIEDVIIPREERLAEVKRILIDSPEISGSIAIQGSRIDDVVLKNHFVTLENIEHVVMMSPSGSEKPHYTESGWLAKDSKILVPSPDTIWSVKGSDAPLSPSHPVTFQWSNGQGLTFGLTYSIDEHFLISVTQSVTNSTNKAVSLYPYSAVTRRGVPHGFEKGVGYEGPLGYIGDEMHEISYGDMEDEPVQTFSALNGWIGFGEKYWLSAVIPSQMSMHTYRFQMVPNKKDKNMPLYQLDARGDEMVVEPNKTIEDTSHIFIGAKKLSLLSDYQDELSLRHFDLAVDFGVLYFLTKPLYITLIFLYGLVGNFGVAVILLTVVVRALVFPLANKSYRSFAALRKVSPKMAEIKARYGSDKPKLQQELVKLYETEKVNPMAGCFPLLLQIPIFFAVYKVITIAVEMRHAPFFGWIKDLSAHDPLSVFNFFGLLPFDVPTFMMIGPWSLLMLAMLLIQKQFNPPPQDQIQRDIANYMPWLMTYMLSNFASALVIYWAFSNLFSVIQQAFIMRSMGVPIYLFSPDAAREHHESHKKETAKVLGAIQEEKDAEAAESSKEESKADKTHEDKSKE